MQTDSHSSFYSGNYDVLNDRAVAVWLAMERGAGHEPTIVYQSSSDESEDVFSIGVDAGRKYVWCFEYDEEDEDDDIEPMLVGFNLRVVPVPRSLPDEEIGPDAQRALELVETAELVQNDWQNLMDHYDFLRNREGLHAELTMQIHNRVMGWTLLEASLVILMAVGQVMYWKKFFEQRRYL